MAQANKILTTLSILLQAVTGVTRRFESTWFEAVKLDLNIPVSYRE